MHKAYRHTIPVRRSGTQPDLGHPQTDPPPTPGTTWWNAPTLKAALGGSAYSGEAAYGAYETYIGRPLNFVQTFDLQRDNATLTTGEFEKILLPTHWTRTGGRQRTVTITHPLLACTKTANSPNATFSGQSLATVAGNLALNRPHWQAMGALIAAYGLDSLWPDGRPKLVNRWGHETNVGAIGNRFFGHQFFDPTSAAQFNDILSDAYQTAQAEMDHPENVGWCFAMAAKTVDDYATLDAACPDGSIINLVDCDIYNDNFRYQNRTALQKRTQDAAVKADMFQGTQGMDASLTLARSRNAMCCYTEWANQIRDVPQNGSGDSGGGDNASFQDDMESFLRLGPLADGRLLYMDYTWSDIASNGDFLCKLDTGKFPAAKARFDLYYK